MPDDFTSAHVLDLGTHKPAATILQGVLSDLDALFNGARVADKPSAAVVGVSVAVQQAHVLAHGSGR